VVQRSAVGERVVLARRRQKNIVISSPTAITEAKYPLDGLQTRKLSRTARPLIFGHRTRVRLVGSEILSRSSVHGRHLRSPYRLEILPSAVAHLTH